jgi:NAD(P)-dependent dehydrogenase (short-subunit alcohol dehydrogenase family)
MKCRWSKGKHAIITGASDGIGRELARYLLGSCRKLTITARNKDGKLDAVLRELQDKALSMPVKTEIAAHSLDINDLAGMRELIKIIYDEDKDQVDLLINSAGGTHIFAPFETLRDYDIEYIFDTNARSPIFFLRELLPRMKNNEYDENEQKRAQVVFMSSRSAERSLPNLSIYSASKGAIEKLCESLRVEYAPFRIAFTVINPGSINTAFTKDWTREAREAHNAEAMLVRESITPITDAIDSRFSVNKVSFESMQQWINEPVTVKLWK